MANREPRGNKEKKKPKAAHNQKKKGGPAPQSSGQAQVGSNPFAKKA